MPLGFSGGANLIAMGERYGDKLAQGIERGGAIIEQALQRVTTQRQLEGLGQTLSQIDPKTPDYTQKLMEIAPQFPFAMKDPRGQAIFSMGVQAHKQWEQGEQAKQMFTNQQTMQGIRQRDALEVAKVRNQGRDPGVDLSGLNVPQQLTPQNPASGLSGPVAGVLAGAQENAPPPDETATLMGMSGSLDSISERALIPLAGAQKVTGRMPSGNQVFGAIAAERTRDQQTKEREAREAESERKASVKAEADKVEAEKKTIETARKEKLSAKIRRENTAIAVKRGLLQSKYSDAQKAVKRAQEEYDSAIVPPEEEYDPKKKKYLKGDDYFRDKAVAEKALQRAGEAAAELEKELSELVDVEEDDGGETPRFRYEGGKLVPK